eukprot:m.183687 g.183687  ORF g.183687 m.183687 type:complete len:116 (+) comp32165_c1_seq9:184-531(+)
MTSSPSSPSSPSPLPSSSSFIIITITIIIIGTSITIIIITITIFFYHHFFITILLSINRAALFECKTKFLFRHPFPVLLLSQSFITNFRQYCPSCGEQYSYYVTLRCSLFYCIIF